MEMSRQKDNTLSQQANNIITSNSSSSSSTSSSSSSSDEGGSSPRQHLPTCGRKKHNNFIKKEETSWSTEEESSEEVDKRRVLHFPPIVPAPEAESSLPLRTQIRLLVEKALALQLQENSCQNPRRSWGRRQIDTFALRLLVFAMRYHRELFILFLFFVSGLASLRTCPIRTRSTPEPKPFFDNPQTPLYMEDLYKGEYVDLVQTKINLGPAFIFYYAPWDSESVAARDVFLNVARHYASALPKRIRFYAVNCWWPQGECRKNYKNLSHFPIFVAHVERNAGIIYSGPIRAELIIKFLSHILKPLTRIDSEEELWRFRAQHDGIMLSYFNFTEEESVQAYETYRQMAMRNFEGDPFGQVGYGIFLRQELAEKYFLTGSNVISLVLFNEIHTAKWSGEKDVPGIRGPVGQVANWVLERTRKPIITWAYQIRTGFANRPVALGPMDLSDELAKGPVMLLITRRYFPSSYSPFYAQMKEVALDYFNCNRSGNVTRLRQTAHKINSEWTTLSNSISKICTEQGSSPSGSCLLLKDQIKHWKLKKNAFQRESLANYELASDQMNFTGLSCMSDRQFKFFAVDPIDIPYFMELGFGGLGFNKDSDPVAFIIDAQNEIIIPFSKFNITKLAEMIYEYTLEAEGTRGSSRMFSSHWWSDSSIHTLPKKPLPKLEVSEDDYSFAQEILDKKLEKLRPKVEQGFDKPPEKSKSYLLKINSEDLDKFLRRAPPFHLPTPMFLLHTAAFCGSCGIALTSFVELSRFMSDYYQLGVNITFAKIDMNHNTLPFGMYPDKIPAFAFLPGNARFNAKVFPIDEKINSKNLLKFLLTELDPETRIKLSLQSPGCTSSNSQYCPAADKTIKRNKYNKSACVPQQNSESSNSTSPRDACISKNKKSVTEKLQYIFNEIQNGYYSHPQSNIETELGINMDILKIQDLDHLRSMRITLDAY